MLMQIIHLITNIGASGTSSWLAVSVVNVIVVIIMMTGTMAIDVRIQ